jgi:hypothetical protein
VTLPAAKNRLQSMLRQFLNDRKQENLGGFNYNQ